MDYQTFHKYIKEMVSRGDLGIVIDDRKIVLQVKDLVIEDEDIGLQTTKGVEGVYNREVTDNDDFSMNHIGFK